MVAMVIERYRDRERTGERVNEREAKTFKIC